ncbi:MAG: GNAT family N-acetyltransferase [Myxococcales bacterium]|nr:GNAT family N-acetyltransferase [Myxococcales bacterium]
MTEVNTAGRDWIERGTATPARVDTTVEVIRDTAQWDALAPLWDPVLRRTQGYTGMQSYDFLRTWWHEMGDPHQLFILAFRRAGSLLGLAPLQIARRSLLGKPYRTLEFIGMPEEILLPGFLFPTEHAPALRASLLECLAAHTREWDHIKLEEIAANDPVLESLSALSRRCRLIHRVAPLHPCPYLDISDGTDAGVQRFWAGRSRKLVKNVRAAERKLRRSGEVAVQTYRTPEELDAGMGVFMAVEQRGWKRKQGLGMAADDRYEAFYRRLLQTFANHHGARIMTLSVAGQPISATAGILYDRVYCSLQIAHDDSFGRFSPGTLLEYYEMDALLRDGGVDRYEFLGGAPNNKFRWTSHKLDSVYVHARKTDVRTLAHDAYKYRARPLAKDLLSRGGLSIPQVRKTYRRIEQRIEKLLGVG